uniref:Uncharacterized protein n=1 Tax=Tanacetum cinerariifolium TaxID=118510 RepID=A0A6L2KXZ5_TANCI|nr:hypothetical protein [Tanacetum cinerariifolium]
MVTKIDEDVDVVLEEAKDVVADAKDGQDVDVQDNADIQGRTPESQVEIYKINLDHANKVLSMHEEESEPAELQEVVDIVATAKIITEVVTASSTTITTVDVLIPAATTAAALKLTTAPSRRTKGVVIRDPEESTTTTSTIIHSKAKSKDKVKEILAKEDKSVKRYQAMKRKPQTKAQARKNMMVYLKNVAGFKMDYFKEESRALKRINETPTEKAAKRKMLEEEVEELKIHLQIVPNEDDDIITFTTTQLIFLVERRYPLTRFTLDQMLNNVRLKVEEESEVSLELLSFGVDAAKEFKMMLLTSAAKIN